MTKQTKIVKMKKDKKFQKQQLPPRVQNFLPKGDVLGKLVMDRSLTPQGADWLIAALDPFHDRKHPLAGFPDVDSSSTIVTHVDAYMDVSHAAADWHGHLFTLPVLRTRPTFGGTWPAGVSRLAVDANTTAYNLGNVNFIAHNSAVAESLFPDTAVWAPAGVTVNNLVPGDLVSDGFSRVIGMGIEVIDQTPDLYKGGTITCYRLPQRPMLGTPSVASTMVGDVFDGNVQVRSFRSPPKTASEAVKLQGSTMWEAKEGAYAAVPLNTCEVPMTGYSHELNWFNSLSTTPIGTYGTLIGHYPTAAPSIAPIVTSQKSTNMDTVGFFFSNMNTNSRFRVRVRYYVERAPSAQDEAALLVSATPSAPYDVKALQYYQIALTNLPVATKVGDNANGDWFRNVLKTIARYAVPVLDVFGFGKPARAVQQTADNVIHALGQALPFLP